MRYIVVAIFTGIVFVGVEGALIAFIIKYRRGKRPRTAEGLQIHGSTKLEVIWTVLPVVILALIGAFVFYKLPGIADAPKAAAADETTITIEGHQFYWLFRYPNGAVSINRMVAPANEVVNERVVGLDWDVNHSWWVPELGGKYDAIPGRSNKTWFKAPVGSYDGAVRRALRHPARLDARPGRRRAAGAVRRSSSRTAQTSSSASDLALGKEEWQGVCSSCHRLANKYVGPALQGQPAARRRARAHHAAAQRPGSDAGRRAQLVGPPDPVAGRVHQAVREGRIRGEAW